MRLLRSAADALALNMQPGVLSLLNLRFSQIAGDVQACEFFVLVEPMDQCEAIERVSGCPIFASLFGECAYGDLDFVPAFEWLDEHAGFYEMVFVFSDDGCAVTILVPKEEGIDVQLLKFCKEFASPASV